MLFNNINIEINTSFTSFNSINNIDYSIKGQNIEIVITK